SACRRRITVALRRFSTILPELVSTTVSRRKTAARCACSSRSAFMRSISSCPSRLESEWAWPSLRRAQLWRMSSTGTPHSLARVLIRFRAILIILFERCFSIQSLPDCLYQQPSVLGAYTGPDRPELLGLRLHESFQAFEAAMEVTAAAWRPHFEIGDRHPVAHRDSHHRILTIPRHASETGPKHHRRRLRRRQFGGARCSVTAAQDFCSA